MDGRLARIFLPLLLLALLAAPLPRDAMAAVTYTIKSVKVVNGTWKSYALYDVTVTITDVRAAPGDPAPTVYLFELIESDLVWDEYLGEKAATLTGGWTMRADGQVERSVERTFRSVSGYYGTDWICNCRIVSQSLAALAVEDLNGFGVSLGELTDVAQTVHLEGGDTPIVGFEWGTCTADFSGTPLSSGGMADVFCDLQTGTLDYTVEFVGGETHTGQLTGLAPSNLSGACCEPQSPDCIVTTAEGCADIGGCFAGNGTLCAGDGDQDGRDDACASCAQALPTKVLIVKPGRLFKFVAKGRFMLPDRLTDDPRAEGGSLEFGGTSGGTVYALPAAGWGGLGPGGDGSKGFKFKGAGCKVVIVKEAVVKGVCGTDTGGFALPESGPVDFQLTVGTSTTRYCGSCGGTPAGNADALYKRKACPAEAECTAEAP
jgi:hypothetical protein